MVELVRKIAYREGFGNVLAEGTADPRPEFMRQLDMAVALRPGDANVLYNAACCYGVLQRKAESLAMIKRAFEAGYGNRHWAARDPDLTCLRDEPEFQALCAPKA